MQKPVIIPFVIAAVFAGRVACAADSAAPSAPGSLSVAAAFGDGMVLQREMPVPVWGAATPGAKVAVAFGGQVKATTGGADGKWSVKLNAMSASAENRTISISSGTDTVVFKDVLVGEVWLCSGQSNMHWGVNECDVKEEAATANDPMLRIRDFSLGLAPTPQTTIKDGQWLPATPQNLGRSGGGLRNGFSVIAYCFGTSLRRELKVPVGLIQAAWGGSRIEPWTPAIGFQAVPALKTIADQVAAGKLNYDDLQQPTLIYNALIHPWATYAIRGAIWYQGESNRGDGMMYCDKMKALIGGWRQAWNQGNFPFYFVQLAPHNYEQYKQPIPALALPEIWEAQTEAAKQITNTGMAVINDLVTDLQDIHPKNKKPVGERLARLALSRTYGFKFTDDCGPIFKAMAIEKNKIRIAFDHAASGLASRDGKPLDCFEIAGADGKFLAASAEIAGKLVIVSNPQIAEPREIRFAWNECAMPNLMNGDKLPASAFQTHNGAKKEAH